jgi:organic hydroperoxide reductase OsmC/OhrA
VSTTTETTVRNGVDTARLYATLDAIKGDPTIAKFQFRARNLWIWGAHNRTTIRDFYAANQEDTSRADEFTVDAGEPAILLGTDTGPNPAEYLLHALAACLTTSLVYVAAARGASERGHGEDDAARSDPANSRGSHGSAVTTVRGKETLRCTVPLSEVRLHNAPCSSHRTPPAEPGSLRTRAECAKANNR